MVVVVPTGLVGHTARNRSDWVQCRVLNRDIHCLVEVSNLNTGLLTSVRVGSDTIDLRIVEIQLRSIGTALGVPALRIDLRVGCSDANQGVVPVVLFVVVEVHERRVHHDDLTGHIFCGSTVVTVFLVGSTVTIGHGS